MVQCKTKENDHQMYGTVLGSNYFLTGDHTASKQIKFSRAFLLAYKSSKVEKHSVSQTPVINLVCLHEHLR